MHVDGVFSQFLSIYKLNWLDAATAVAVCVFVCDCDLCVYVIPRFRGVLLNLLLDFEFEIMRRHYVASPHSLSNKRFPLASLFYLLNLT